MAETLTEIPLEWRASASFENVQETARKTRLLAAFLLAALVVVPTLSLAPTATAATDIKKLSPVTNIDTPEEKQAANNCLKGAKNLKSTVKAEQRGFTSQGQFDFACSGKTVMIQNKDRTVQLTGNYDIKPTVTASTPVTFDINIDKWPGWPNEIDTIYDPYTSLTEGVVIYGRSGSNYDFIVYTNIMLTLNLQTLKQHYVYKWSTTFSWGMRMSNFVTLQKMNGILPPNNVEFVLLDSGPGQTSYAVNGYLGDTRNATYSMKMNSFHIEDPDHGWNGTIDQEVSSPRFLCPGTDQCRYPNGKEAPIL